MRIGLDYDGTYTADPPFWDAFIVDAQARGHRVFVVTMREPVAEAIELHPDCSVVYTSRRAKVAFCRELGLQIGIWIDDSPHWLLEDSA